MEKLITEKYVLLDTIYEKREYRYVYSYVSVYLKL